MSSLTNDSNNQPEATTDPYVSDENPTVPAPPEKKPKRTRTVDYTRTDKQPHSFRYKRGCMFTPRAAVINLTKDTDGALVIGATPEVASANTVKLESGALLELVSIKKRPNGKTAIAFKHADLGEVVVYDARHARSTLRVS